MATYARSTDRVRLLRGGGTNPDAELIALSAKCAEAAKARNAASEALEVAEDRRKPLAPPDVILKTKRDFELGLFAGPGTGQPFTREEIDLIRPMVRRLGRTIDHSREDFAAYGRGNEILAAWPAWTATCEAHRLTAENAPLDAADGRYAGLVERLLLIPARTAEGAVAKARAFGSIFPGADVLAERIKADFATFAVDEGVLSLGMVCDLVRLARSTEA